MHKRKVVQYLSKYIKGLNADQVSSRLFSGEVELRDAEFEVEPLKKLLVGTLPYTLEVLAISCDRLQVFVPWSSLRKRSVQVKLGHVRIQVCVHSRSDRQWAESVATSTAIASAQKPQEKREGEEQKSFRLADVKVGVMDNFCISVASLHLLCAHAASGNSQPLFAFEFELGGLSLQPVPFGKVTEKERRARVRRGSWTSLKRRLELQKLRLAAAHLTDKAMKDPILEVQGCSLDLVEGRDIGRRQDHHNPSARMAMFPRQIRMSLNLPEVCTSLHSSEILGLIELVGDANQPTCPPAELLREEMQEEVKAAVAEFLAKRSKSRAFSIFRGSGTKKSKVPNKSHISEMSKPSSNISDMAVEMADVMASKAMKAGAVADAATAAAADTARRTAVAGAQAAQKAAHALGDARRSGQAAAEKALGSLMRAGGLKRSPKKTTSELAASREAATASREEEELQAVLALSLKEFEDQQAAKDAKTCEDESSDVKQQESLCQDDELEDFAGSFLGSSSDSDDRQSVQSVEDLEDEGGSIIEEATLNHGPDTSLAFLENPSQPPPSLRMISLHAAIRKFTLILPVPGDSTQFSLELSNLNFSGDTYLYLFSSEIKCLRRLAVLKDEIFPAKHPGVFACHSSSGSLTICSATLRFGDHPLLAVQHLVKATPWMLTLRISRSSLYSMTSPKVEVAMDGCLHNLRLCPDMAALKAVKSCSLALQATVDAIAGLNAGKSAPKSTPKSIPESWCVKVQLWNTLVDFKTLCPSPLRSLQLILPELRFKGGDGDGFFFSPPVPQWHVVPVQGEGEPDFYLYDSESGVEVEADSKYSKSFEGTWEVLVTEREWRQLSTGEISLAQAWQRLLLPAEEMLDLSRAKLKVLEGAQLLEDLAERQHADSCRTVEREAAELLPQVEATIAGDGRSSLEAQLEGLRAELRDLDERRREEELRLRQTEKELGTQVAKFRCDKMVREQELQRQLQEEEMITSTLAQLVAQQAELLAKLDQAIPQPT